MERSLELLVLNIKWKREELKLNLSEFQQTEKVKGTKN